MNPTALILSGALAIAMFPPISIVGSLFDLFSVTFREAWVVQKFLPEVKDQLGLTGIDLLSFGAADLYLEAKNPP